MRVPDTHEAIITQETFDKVQALLLRDTRTTPRGRELHLLSGFLRCADCGKAVTRSQSGKNIYYACSTYACYDSVSSISQSPKFKNLLSFHTHSTFQCYTTLKRGDYDGNATNC